ncbi:MAG: hypothetical protein AB8F74_17315 [Saprospiraceae bacterium]
MENKNYFNTTEKEALMNDINNLKRRATQYKEIVANTRTYREIWKESLKDAIVDRLTELSKGAELEGEIEVKSTIENLEAIVFSLGEVKSGIWENVNDNIKRHLIKHNGSLIYQQLFNGKIIVMMNYPLIEGYGQPAPPKTIAIYRPEEIKAPFILRHMEDFIKEMTNWEDYDDDEPATQQKIGYQLNFLNPEDT